MTRRLFAPLVVVVAILLPAGATPAAMAERGVFRDQVIEAEAAAMKARVYSTPTKERREMSQGGVSMIMIMRHDKKVIWNLMPEEKMYMEIAMKESSDKTDMSAYKIEQTPSGRKRSTARSWTRARSS